jgi:tetratricopeptide (TPR) repeat protein
MRRLALICGLGVLSAGTARAEDVDALGGKVLELDTRVSELDRALKPPAEPGPEIAERRLIDAQVLYELKNYEAASMILFDVVEKYPQASAYPEALFYLADSLFLKRDYLSSRRFFEKIVELGPSQRRYQEALQRLIDLSLHTGDYSPVDGYIAKLEGLPADKQLPSVPYVKGKYFFFRQTYDKALESLKGIGPTHVYYIHALYFVGAANVALGGEHLDDALLAFATILKNPPKTDSQKRIAELAHLAMARIYLDRGQLTNSLDEYGKIPTKSDYFNDSLYESAWVAIKGKDYVKARRSLDLLLTNAPESSLAPEVKLLIGSLHIREESYGPATDQFAKTREEYDPIHKQLAADLQKAGDAPAYFRELIAKNLNKFDTTAVLASAAAGKWVKPEPEVERVSTLIGDEAELRKSLDESDEIVRRLEKALSGPSRVNVFPELAAARGKGLDLSDQLTQVRKQLTKLETQLVSPVIGSEKATLDRLEADRSALEAQLATMPTRADQIALRAEKARYALNEIDKHASELQTILTGLRNQVNAARTLYHDNVDKSVSGEAPLPPQVSAPRPDSPNLPFLQKKSELDKRLGEVKTQIERAKGRVDKLKDLVLQGQAARPELEACTTEVDAAQIAIYGVRKDVEDSSVQVGVDDPEMQQAQQVKTQLDELLRRQHALGLEVRSRLGADARVRAEQIESILERGRGVQQKIAAFNAHIDSILDVRLKEFHSQLVDEKAHVVGYRTTLAGYTGESAEVGGGVVAENFKKVTKRFYDVVVRSDVGIIDVAWALKDSATRETSRLVAERKRELKLLDDEFKQVNKDQP